MRTWPCLWTERRLKKLRIFLRIFLSKRRGSKLPCRICSYQQRHREEMWVLVFWNEYPRKVRQKLRSSEWQPKFLLFSLKANHKENPQLHTSIMPHRIEEWWSQDCALIFDRLSQRSESTKPNIQVNLDYRRCRFLRWFEWAKSATFFCTLWGFVCRCYPGTLFICLYVLHFIVFGDWHQQRVQHWDLRLLDFLLAVSLWVFFLLWMRRNKRHRKVLSLTSK